MFLKNIILALLAFSSLSNAYSQAQGEINPSIAFEFFKFCTKLDSSYQPNLSNIEVREVNKGSVAEINVLQESEKYIIEITTKFDTIIREHILIEGLYTSNTILPPFGSGFGGIDLYYNYYNYIDKEPSLTAFIGDIADFGIFKEARIASEKLEYLLCYNFIFYHELYHIYNGDIKEKVKINKKILKSFQKKDIRKINKYHESIMVIETKADSFAFARYSKSVHNLINGLSDYFIEKGSQENNGLVVRGAIDFPNVYGECSPITTKTLVILKNLENKNVYKHNLVTPQDRLLKIIDMQKRNRCQSVDIVNDTTSSEQDGLSLLLKLFEVASQNKYPTGYVQNLMDSLEHDSAYIKLPKLNQLNFLLDAIDKSDKKSLTILDKAEIFLRGDKNIPQNIDSAYYYFKACADSLNRDTLNRTIRRNTNQFSDYEIYYKLDFDKSSSQMSSIFAPLTQKEKLNAIVIIMCIFYSHDFVEAEKYYSKIENQSFYVPEYVRNQFKTLIKNHK